MQSCLGFIDLKRTILEYYAKALGRPCPAHIPINHILSNPPIVAVPRGAIPPAAARVYAEPGSLGQWQIVDLESGPLLRGPRIQDNLRDCPVLATK
jgi:hypothetical protein